MNVQKNMRKMIILITIIIASSLAFSGCIDNTEISDDLTKKNDYFNI